MKTTLARSDLTNSASTTQKAMVGTAGWSIGRDSTTLFAQAGSHLERYSKILRCAEVNSTFYRAHRPSTFARWAASTPDDFRFSVKMPKSITHECDLSPDRRQLQSFFSQLEELGRKLGPILVQLPPRQILEFSVAKRFFENLRNLHPEGHIALEPRHASWFLPGAEVLLQQFGISLVIADPAIKGTTLGVGASSGLIYRRLHGSPRVYYSSYSTAHLQELSVSITDESTREETWCIFDNTASGAALQNALALVQMIS